MQQQWTISQQSCYYSRDHHDRPAMTVRKSVGVQGQKDSAAAVRCPSTVQHLSSVTDGVRFAALNWRLLDAALSDTDGTNMSRSVRAISHT